ncbi:TIM barrel protein [Paenibacillus sp. WST5]|uniref:TIM barrel protein n=2 Tax=Paenibacillus sedimenti TaxID=2770274 RepID=A0A926QHV5_9BACL|nr:TIM barrel protein [Paenibacillus sedimenti]
MKLSVCVDALFRNQDFTESVRKIKAAGCDTIEFWTWWDKDLEAVGQAVSENGVSVAAICTRFISLVDVSHREAYMQGLRESIAVAQRLNCHQLISQVGQELEGVSREEQKQSLIEGLRNCVPMLEQAGITLLVEPLNTRVDHKGYFLASSSEAFDIIKQVGSPHVRVLYDIYHQQITEGHIMATINNNIKWIGHFHAAGIPGRRELITGELAYDRIFQAIKATGYTGAVGLEYFPENDAAEGIMQAFDLSTS